MDPVSANLRRLLAERDWTIHEAAEQIGVDERTLKGLLGGRGGKPHSRTLHRLATGFDVPVETFLVPPGGGRAAFDRDTNPAVAEAVDREPHLFADWTVHDFDELCSRFGAGGALTVDGALSAARDMNRKRRALEHVALILESGEADLMYAMIDALSRRVVMTREESPRRG
jgi:transcriptional regulator with XRE-family HTH domain